jgi:hypothetical protein
MYARTNSTTSYDEINERSLFVSLVSFCPFLALFFLFQTMGGSEEGPKNVWGEPLDRPAEVEGGCLERTANALVSLLIESNGSY